MEHVACPACGSPNLTTDPQCLSCGTSLLVRPVPTPMPVSAMEPETAPSSFWETPTGQRRIALISGSVMLVCLWVILRGVFGFMLIPLLVAAGIWELCAWSREREQNKRFEGVRDKATLQAELARLDRPDRIVQTKSGPVSVRGFDSRLDD